MRAHSLRPREVERAEQRGEQEHAEQLEGQHEAVSTVSPMARVRSPAIGGLRRASGAPRTIALTTPGEQRPRDDRAARDAGGSSA